MRMLTEAEHERLLAADRERARLDALINSPEVDGFLRGVHLEAVHQVERWGTVPTTAPSARPIGSGWSAIWPARRCTPRSRVTTRSPATTAFPPLQRSTTGIAPSPAGTFACARAAPTLRRSWTLLSLARLPMAEIRSIDLQFNEGRRPGITKLADRLARENPSWDSARLLTEAKARYSSRTIAVRKDGRLVEIANPDYMGGCP